MKVMTLTEPERKLLCEYLLEQNVNNEVIHRTCCIVSCIINSYKEDVATSRKEQYRLQRELNLKSSTDDYETFSSSRTECNKESKCCI